MTTEMRAGLGVWWALLVFLTRCAAECCAMVLVVCACVGGRVGLVDVRRSGKEYGFDTDPGIGRQLRGVQWSYREVRRAGGMHNGPTPSPEGTARRSKRLSAGHRWTTISHTVVLPFETGKASWRDAQWPRADAQTSFFDLLANDPRDCGMRGIDFSLHGHLIIASRRPFARCTVAPVSLLFTLTLSHCRIPHTSMQEFELTPTGTIDLPIQPCASASARNPDVGSMVKGTMRSWCYRHRSCARSIVST